MKTYWVALANDDGSSRGAIILDAKNRRQLADKLLRFSITDPHRILVYEMNEKECAKIESLGLSKNQIIPPEQLRDVCCSICVAMPEKPASRAHNAWGLANNPNPN